jgi:hypothetical protein
MHVLSSQKNDRSDHGVENDWLRKKRNEWSNDIGDRNNSKNSTQSIKQSHQQEVFHRRNQSPTSIKKRMRWVWVFSVSGNHVKVTVKLLNHSFEKMYISIEIWGCVEDLDCVCVEGWVCDFVKLTVSKDREAYPLLQFPKHNEWTKWQNKQSRNFTQKNEYWVRKKEKGM